MRHWSQLGIRNWRVKPGRAAGAIGAIALGVGVVIWVTCAYASMRAALRDQVWFYVGKAHLSVESMYGSTGTVFQSIEEQARSLPNVKAVTSQLKHKMQLVVNERPEGETQPVRRQPVEIQAIGIDPATEYEFRNYPAKLFDEQSRVLHPGDTTAAMMEQRLADRLGLGLGDHFTLRSAKTNFLGLASVKEEQFELVGLLEYRRIAKQQLPTVIIPIEQAKKLAQLDDEIERVTRIDVILDKDDSRAIRTAERRLRAIAKTYEQNFLVNSAEPKIRQAKNAEKQTGFIMVLLSSVALFTAFFIILSTLSMGMVERIAQLGTLRCLGVTRGQMAFLVLSEAVPMGLVGILLGIPVGLLLGRLSVWLAPQYIGQLIVSKNGIYLALIGGALTTLAGALLPAIQAMRVSPLSASRPQSKPTPALLTWLAFVVGLAMIAGHTYMVYDLSPENWLKQEIAASAVFLLYCGYALVTPGLITVVGFLAVRVVALFLRVRPRLLGDQVGRASWRSAAICSGLMVGLSLIVSLVVYSQSLTNAWDFPSDFCEAFVFVNPPVEPQKAAKIRKLPGLADTTCAINEGIVCTVLGQGVINFPFSRFVVGDPEEFFEVANLEFVEGKKDQAIEKLKQGGYVLVTPEFTRVNKVGYGDTVRIRVDSGQRRAIIPFTIAGVVTSPSLQIAANYFNMSGELMNKSVFIVMGTFEDALRYFDVPRQVSLYLLNFDLPSTPPPPAFAERLPPDSDDLHAMAEMVMSWQPFMPERENEIKRLQAKYRYLTDKDQPIGWSDIPALKVFKAAMESNNISNEWRKLTPEQRWQTYREEVIMLLVSAYSGAQSQMYASARALKLQIEHDLNMAILLVSTVPMVALIVAALGVGNLMMTNVAGRTRQIAMLRAVGATKWQVVRLVVGEALVLGTMGSILGVVLGMHAAGGINHIVKSIWGFDLSLTVPWTWVGLGVLFTMSVCLLAGIMPARHAARNNVIDALQTT